MNERAPAANPDMNTNEPADGFSSWDDLNSLLGLEPTAPKAAKPVAPPPPVEVKLPPPPPPPKPKPVPEPAVATNFMADLQSYVNTLPSLDGTPAEETVEERPAPRRATPTPPPAPVVEEVADDEDDEDGPEEAATPGETSEDGDKKKKRRRRRRKKKPGEVAVNGEVPAPVAVVERQEFAPVAVVADLEDEASDEEVAEEIEPAVADDDEGMASPITDWNVPTWHEIIGSLYRPPER